MESKKIQLTMDFMIVILLVGILFEGIYYVINESNSKAAEPYSTYESSLADTEDVILPHNTTTPTVDPMDFYTEGEVVFEDPTPDTPVTEVSDTPVQTAVQVNNNELGQAEAYYNEINRIFQNGGVYNDDDIINTYATLNSQIQGTLANYVSTENYNKDIAMILNDEAFVCQTILHYYNDNDYDHLNESIKWIDVVGDEINKLK